MKSLPRKARAGIIAKADELEECDDPRKAYKPLKGPLRGYYRLTYGRYRAIYTVEEETLASEDVLVRVLVRFVAVGIRKERDKKDVYRVAKKLVDLGLLNIPDDDLGETEQE